MGLNGNAGSGQFGFDGCSHRPAGYRGGALTHYNHPCDASGSQVSLETLAEGLGPKSHRGPVYKAASEGGPNRVG